MRLPAYVVCTTIILINNAWAESEDAKAYKVVRKQYEVHRCEDIKVMREATTALNANDMERGKELLLRSNKIKYSKEALELQDQMMELRQKIMAAHQQEDFDSLLAYEGEVRQGCQ